MSLTNEVKQKIEEKIKPFLNKCPLCGSNDFAVHENIYGFPILELEAKKINLGSAFGAIIVSCANCKNSLIFNAKLAGIKD